MILLQTAAHCVASYSAASLTARVGEWDATSTQDARLPIMGLLVHIAMRTPITLDFSVCMDKAMHTEKFAHAHDHCFDFLCA